MDTLARADAVQHAGKQRATPRTANARRTVQHHVAHDNVLLGIEGGLARRVHRNHAARQALHRGGVGMGDLSRGSTRHAKAGCNAGQKAGAFRGLVLRAMASPCRRSRWRRPPAQE